MEKEKNLAIYELALYNNLTKIVKNYYKKSV